MFKRDYLATFKDKQNRPLAQVIVKNTTFFKVQVDAEKLMPNGIDGRYVKLAVMPISGGVKA